MLWIIIFIWSLTGINAGYRGTSITCVCSTVQCLESHMQYCNTTGMCFSQYLDRQDGSHPVVRGCISSKTPLLCENRRPAIARGIWPVLLCCNTNLCNRDAVPTPPPWLTKESIKNETTLIPEDQNADTNEVKTLDTVEGDHNRSDAKDTPLLAPELDPSVSFQTPFRSKTRSSSLPHIVSPVYISVLILGIISLVIIGVVAATVLRRSNHFYMEQYGALEHQHEQGYLKHGRISFPATMHVHCDCDSEVESVSQCSQPYVHVIYPNRPTNNT